MTAGKPPHPPARRLQSPQGAQRQPAAQRPAVQHAVAQRQPATPGPRPQAPRPQAPRPQAPGRPAAEQLLPVHGGAFRVRGGEAAPRPPTGTYNFVQLHGTTPSSHPLYVSPHLTHAQLAQGKPVVYAGTARFEQGRMEWWSNYSGTYQPVAAFRAQAKLPGEKFVPWQTLQLGGHAMQRTMLGERKPAGKPENPVASKPQRGSAAKPSARTEAAAATPAASAAARPGGPTAGSAGAPSSASKPPAPVQTPAPAGARSPAGGPPAQAAQPRAGAPARPAQLRGTGGRQR